jgi:hypothetical protein
MLYTEKNKKDIPCDNDTYVKNLTDRCGGFLEER